METSCKYCEKSINLKPSAINPRGNYCSKDCWHKSDITRPSRKTGVTKTHICKICKSQFKWSPSRSKNGANNITYCSIACRDTDPIQRARLIAMNALQQKGNPTKPERIGYALLEELKIPHERQHLIGGKFCVDAFASEAKTVIQFDGDYWHANPRKFPEPDARQKKRMHLDKSQDAYMEACGYSVIRIWESDLLRNLESVKARLRLLLAPA